MTTALPVPTLAAGPAGLTLEGVALADIAARFESSETLGKVVVPIHQDFRREVHVFLLKGFKGY